MGAGKGSVKVQSKSPKGTVSSGKVVERDSKYFATILLNEICNFLFIKNYVELCLQVKIIFVPLSSN